MIADELALDADDWMRVVRGSYAGELSQDQTTSLADLDRKLHAISRNGSDFAEEVWSESALGTSPHWTEIRGLASKALAAFGWPLQSPPRDPSARGITYLR